MNNNVMIGNSNQNIINVIIIRFVIRYRVSDIGRYVNFKIIDKRYLDVFLCSEYGRKKFFINIDIDSLSSRTIDILSNFEM